MKEKKMTKAPITQAAKLKFPQDTVGFTSAFKREAARAIGRIGGKEDKLAIFLETLEILREYAVNKTEAQVAAVKVAREAEKEKVAKALEDDKKRKARRIASKEAEIALLTREIEALEPKAKGKGKAK